MQKFGGTNKEIMVFLKVTYVAQVLHNNRLKVPKNFFHYCSVHQRRDVKPRIIRAFDLFFHQWNEFGKIIFLSFIKNKTRAAVNVIYLTFHITCFHICILTFKFCNN